MKATRALVALGTIAGLAACAIDPLSQPPAPTSAAIGASKSSAEELVAYLARIRGMGESALVAEAARHKREASGLGRVKAALALSLTAQAEESDILALVDAPARKENIDADVRAMASFVQALATERRRLKESAAASAVRLRDERRAHEAQKQRTETLQQKLDALTELEKSLSDRQVPSR